MEHKRIAKSFSGLMLLLCVAAAAHAQEGTLWGSAKDGRTGQFLSAEVSIIHPARPHVQFFYAQSSPATGWEMRSLPPGEKILIARAEGYGFAWQRVVVEPGQTLGPVDFALQKAATLEGQVKPHCPACKPRWRKLRASA